MNKIFIQAKGGLGNQLFYFALAFALAQNFPNSKIYIDKTKYLLKKMHEGFLLDNLINLSNKSNFKIESSNLSSLIKQITSIYFKFKVFKPIQKINEEEPYIYQNLLFNRPVIYLNGYWQSYKYFINESLMTKIVSDYLNLSLDKKISSPIKTDENNIAIHVRKGDYIGHPDYVELSQNYYINAIEYIKEKCINPKFYVFTDSVNGLPKNFFFNNEFRLISKNYTSVQSLALMSKCDHFITANSSFSWWGAFLGANKKKIILTPADWFTFQKNLNDFIPATWIKINIY